MIPKTLQVEFQADLSGIAKLLVQRFGLKFDEHVQNLSDPLLRWLDFSTRYIEHRPRRIVASSKFPLLLPAATEAALQELEQRFLEGRDVNLFQSKGLTTWNDTSSRKRQLRTDLLWANWGIHHLHLTGTVTSHNASYSERSDWLLLCLVLPDEVGFIDVRRHDEMNILSSPELIQQMIQDWPDYMTQFRMKGALPSFESHSAEEIAMAWKGGVNLTFEYDGYVYMSPGFGITSASTPTRLTLKCDRLRSAVNDLAGLVGDEQGVYWQAVREHGIVHQPDFHIQLTPRGLAVMEMSSNIAFPLPRQTSLQTNWLTSLHDSLVPEWVVKQM